MTKPFFSLFLILLLGTLAFGCQAQSTPGETNEYGLPVFPAFRWPPRHYICYQTNEPLQIDGILSEEDWSRAPWSEEFLDIMGSHFPTPLHATRMKMLWDDHYLYVAAYMQEPDLWATITERDEVIFYDNDFEVFIDPDADTYGYFELEINALNTVWDLMLIRPYRNGGPAINNWDINGLKTAVYLDGTLNNPSDTDKGWQVEMAIPLEAINEYNHGPRPADGAHWRINFSRVQWRYSVVDGVYQKDVNPDTGKSWPEDNWVWSPQGVVDMHLPELWGILQFSTLEPGKNEVEFTPNPDDPIKWELRNVYYAQRLYREQNGKYAGQLNKLESVGLDLSVVTFNPEVMTTYSGFQIKATSPQTGRNWLIDEGGRIRGF